METGFFGAKGILPSKQEALLFDSIFTVSEAQTASEFYSLFDDSESANLLPYLVSTGIVQVLPRRALSWRMASRDPDYDAATASMQAAIASFYQTRGASRTELFRRGEELFDSLKKVCEIQAPWIFLCSAAAIDYLSAAAYPNLKPWDKYKKFIETYFPAAYRKFKYRNGSQDLPTQMYYVLRNGLVHSFSLLPDDRGAKHGGRPRSIILNHKANVQGAKHLSRVYSPPRLDAVRLVAEDFLEDTRKAGVRLARAAKKDPVLAANVLARFEKHPHIAWHGPSGNRPSPPNYHEATTTAL